MKDMGKILMILGSIIFFTGLILSLSGNLFSWFGRLPGDIRIEKENFRFYAPIVSMLLISAVLSIVINIIIRIFGKH